MCIFHENQSHRMSKNSCSILSYLMTLNCIAFYRHFKEQAVTDDNKRIIAVKTWVFIFVLPALVGYPVEQPTKQEMCFIKFSLRGYHSGLFNEL